MTRLKAGSLTNDEKKAAEAAFQGAPFDPAWSDAARAVYDGLSRAMAKREHHPLAELQVEMETEAVLL